MSDLTKNKEEKTKNILDFCEIKMKEDFLDFDRNKNLFNTHSFLENKSLNEIAYSQFLATQKVFSQKKIPYRSFIINNRDEQTLGELFTFFILETILLGRVMKVNPFDQPAVELIKKQTKKILISKNYS